MEREGRHTHTHAHSHTQTFARTLTRSLNVRLQYGINGASIVGGDLLLTQQYVYMRREREGTLRQVPQQRRLAVAVGTHQAVSATVRNK